MFNNSTINASTTSGGGEIVQSGYDAKGQLQNFGDMRNQFREALTLTPEDATEVNIVKNSRLAGSYKGYNAMLKRASRAKLQLAQSINQTYSTSWQHIQGAMSQELQWQNTTARNLEQASEKMLDMQTTQATHAGFSTYCNAADKIITY